MFFLECRRRNVIGISLADNGGTSASRASLSFSSYVTKSGVLVPLYTVSPSPGFVTFPATYSSPGAACDVSPEVALERYFDGPKDKKRRPLRRSSCYPPMLNIDYQPIVLPPDDGTDVLA